MKEKELVLFFAFVLITTSVLSKKTNSTSTNATDSINVSNVTVADNITEEAPKESEKDSILSQLRALEEQIALNNKKVQVLERMRTHSSDKDHTGFPSEVNHTQTPLENGQTTITRSPYEITRTRGDSQSLMNKILKRYTFELPQAVKEMSYLPIKSIQKSSDEPPVNTLVVFLTGNNNLLIYELNGKLLLAFEPKHQVKGFTVNQMTDENFIATLGTDNTIRMHIVNISRVLDDTEGNKPKDKAKYDLSVVIKLEYIYDLENDLIISEAMCDKLCLERIEQNYEAFTSIHIRQLKQLTLRSENGNLLVLNRNGTLKGKYQFQGENLLNLQKYHPNPIFATENTIGFFNLAALDTAKPACDSPGAAVLKIEPEQYSSNYFYVLLINGDILVYETKQTDNPCRILTKKSIMGDTQKLRPVNIYSTRNFLLVQKDIKGLDLVAYNVTDVVLSGAINFENYEISLYPLKTDIDKVVKGKYITQRSGYSSNIIGAYFEFQNGTSVFSLQEINIITKSGGEWLDDIRLPLIAIAIIAVVGYQFYNKKKSTQGRGGHRHHNHGPGEECNDDHGHSSRDYGSRVVRKDPPGVTRRKVGDEQSQKYQEFEELKRQYEELQKKASASKIPKSSKDSKKKVTFEDMDDDGEEYQTLRKSKNRDEYEEVNDDHGEEDEDYEEEYEKYYKKQQ